MKEFVKVMKALSDPNRVKILKMLQHKTMCVCELQGALGVSQPTVSKHLKILEDAGFVTSFKDGLWVNYHLDTGSGIQSTNAFVYKDLSRVCILDSAKIIEK